MRSDSAGGGACPRTGDVLTGAEVFALSSHRSNNAAFIIALR
jgi:hypothetical protein